MEKDSAVEIFCRSVQKHNLRYTVYVGDGDTSSLRKKGVKSSTTYFPGAFSESKEPDIPINEKKQKVQKIPLTFISDDQIPQLHVHEQ